MQYLIKLLPKSPPRFAQYWTGADWTDDVDEGYHYNARSDAAAEVLSITEDCEYDADAQVVSIEERS